MFVRLKRSVQGGRTYEYIRICESRREGGKVRQRVIANVGRREELVADGGLDSLIRSLGRFSSRLEVVETIRSEGMRARSSKSWGPALVFGRLWQEQRVPEILRRLSANRRFSFDLERTTFALALQPLCEPGSDLQGSSWVRTVECPGFEAIELQHLYRTVGGFLAKVREELETELFFQNRDLFSTELDLVFIDTTSTYVWREEESPLRRRGHSRDRRPDQP